MRDSYRVNDIYRSIQGEGSRAGTLNVFLRFAGCNQTCRAETHGFDCDTEFESGRTLRAGEIVSRVLACAGACRWVIATGGEPLLQLDPPLLRALKDAGFAVAVETNGSKAWPEESLWPDFIACSPKVAEHAIRLQRADELRYVRGAEQAIPKPSLKTALRYLSPAFGPDGMPEPGAMENCIRLVHENPEWRLSLQNHKMGNAIR